MARARSSGKYTFRSRGRKVSSKPTSQLQIFHGSIDGRDQLADEDDVLLPTLNKGCSDNKTLGDDWTAPGSILNPSSERSGHSSENKSTLPVGHSTLGQSWNDAADELGEILQDEEPKAVNTKQGNGKSSSPFTLKEPQRIRPPRKSGTIALDQSQNTMAMDFDDTAQSEDASFLHDAEDALDDICVPSSSLETDKNSQRKEQKSRSTRGSKKRCNGRHQIDQEKPAVAAPKPKKAPMSKNSKITDAGTDIQGQAARAGSTNQPAQVKVPLHLNQPQNPGMPPGCRSHAVKKPEEMTNPSVQRKRPKQIAKTPFRDSAKNNDDLSIKNHHDLSENGKLSLENETQIVGLHNDVMGQVDTDLTTPLLLQTIASDCISGPAQRGSQHNCDVLSSPDSDETDHMLKLGMLDASTIMTTFSSSPACQTSQRGLPSDFSVLDAFNDEDFREMTGKSKRVVTSKINCEASRNDAELGPMRLGAGTAATKPADRSHNHDAKRVPNPAQPDLESTKLPREHLKKYTAAAVAPHDRTIPISSDESSATSAMNSAEVAIPLLSRQPPHSPPGTGITDKLIAEPLGNHLALSRMRQAGEVGTKTNQVVAPNPKGPTGSGQRSPNKRAAIAIASMGGQNKRIKRNQDSIPTRGMADDSGDANIKVMAEDGDHSPVCAAFIKQTTEIGAGHDVTDNRKSEGFTQEALITQDERVMRFPQESTAASVSASDIGHMTLETYHHERDLQRMDDASRTRTSNRQVPEQLASADGCGAPLRMLSRTRSIVDERGSPKPEEFMTCTNQKAPNLNYRRRKGQPAEKPPAWKKPLREIQPEFGAIQQETTGIQPASGADYEHFLDATGCTHPTESISEVERHNKPVARTDAKPTDKLTCFQKPATLTALAYNSNAAYKKILPQPGTSADRQAPTNKHTGRQAGTSAFLRGNAHREQLKPLKSSHIPGQPQGASASALHIHGRFEGRHDGNDSILRNDGTMKRDIPTRGHAPFQSEDRFPAAVRGIIETLLDQLGAKRPGVAHVAELYWYNGEKAAENLEQLHERERQHMRLSFDNRRLTFVQRCRKMDNLIHDLVRKGQKDTTESAYHSSKIQAERTLDALQRLKVSLGDTSEVV
ncbi:hypothetical protein BN1723_004563 [Verticillium longisporum]|uniref:Uncharacterized protein n=1 Tax=Verticillium longisporum TaxID=100787 RepID=A0A0G4MA74_VERLO|nr:hypothetical protein BN1708_005398 [Verticillium longisporum]CRK39333.1 hypothetical protein BN1723_004563 [Verticillium longisporum]